jgi:hypothetical protein
MSVLKQEGIALNRPVIHCAKLVMLKIHAVRDLGPAQHRYGSYMERVLYGDLPPPRPLNAFLRLRRVVLCNHEAFLQSHGVEVPRVLLGHGHVPGSLERVAAALESLSHAVLTVWQRGSQLWSGAAAAQVPLLIDKKIKL